MNRLPPFPKDSANSGRQKKRLLLKDPARHLRTTQYEEIRIFPRSSRLDHHRLRGHFRSPVLSGKGRRIRRPLLGHWKNTKEADEHWIFEPGADKSLKLTCLSGHETNLVAAHLFKLGQDTFLDLFPLDPDALGFPPAIPSHFLLRVVQLQPTLKMSALDHDWLVKLVQERPGTIAHVLHRSGEKGDQFRVVLTAETAKLQSFVRKQMKNAEAWQDANELRRD